MSGKQLAWKLKATSGRVGGMTSGEASWEQNALLPPGSGREEVPGLQMTDVFFLLLSISMLLYLVYAFVSLVVASSFV